MEEETTELGRIFLTVMYVSHYLHSQTCCDWLVWLRVVTAERPEVLQEQDKLRSVKIKVYSEFSDFYIHFTYLHSIVRCKV